MPESLVQRITNDEFQSGYMVDVRGGCRKAYNTLGLVVVIVVEVASLAATDRNGKSVCNT